MKIIAFTGMAGSGKSTAVEVAKELNLFVFRMGDLIWEEVKKRGLELKDENVGKIATEERKKFGYGIWAERTIKKIKNLNEKVVIIDGLRGKEEIEVYRKAFKKHFVLIAIFSQRKKRYERIKARKRVDDIFTIENFNERDKRELKWGLGNSIALADYLIINEESLRKFRNKIKNLLKELIK